MKIGDQVDARGVQSHDANVKHQTQLQTNGQRAVDVT